MRRSDSKTLWTATVDLDKATFKQINNVGIDYSNEIDAWSKMVFIYRRQIHSLKSYGTFGRREKAKDDGSLYYALRVGVEF